MRSSEKAKVYAPLFCAMVLSVSALADDVVGKVAVANGSVATAAGKALKPGDDIHNEDTINTAPGSTAKLLFTDQSVIDLGSNSSFKVSEYSLNNGNNRTATFSLIYGKIRSLVTKKVGPQGKVNYKSGNAVMGVRGTEFVVDASSKAGSASPAITVVAGVVAVGAIGGAAPIPVNAGEKLVASAAAFAGGAPQVQKVSASEMKSTTEGAKTQDKTFQNSTTISGGGKKSASSETVASIASATVAAQASTEISMTEVGSDKDTNLLPQVNTIPGGLVPITVTIQ